MSSFTHNVRLWTRCHGRLCVPTIRLAGNNPNKRLFSSGPTFASRRGSGRVLMTAVVTTTAFCFGFALKDNGEKFVLLDAPSTSEKELPDVKGGLLRLF